MDIREYYDDGGERKPGRKGNCLHVQSSIMYTITASIKPTHCLEKTYRVCSTHIQGCALIGTLFYSSVVLLHIWRKHGSVPLRLPGVIPKIYLEGENVDQQLLGGECFFISSTSINFIFFFSCYHVKIRPEFRIFLLYHFPGISLNLEQWDALKQSMSDIDERIQRNKK